MLRALGMDYAEFERSPIAFDYEAMMGAHGYSLDDIVAIQTAGGVGHTPLLAWVKGFAEAPAALGEEVTARTMTGRTVTGRLSAINPGYFHTFGQPTPELTHVGADLRTRLAAFRAGGE